jgi:SNF2 family DNA or RNA helicase
MNRSNLHAYQQRAIDFIIQKRRCALWLDMGLGKTVSTLTAISDLTDACIIKRTLVIAPLRVCNAVWRQEAEKWGHLSHLKVNVATGTDKARRKALNAPGDVYVINRENICWLVQNCKGKWPFDAVVVDESSSFKSHATKRFRALRKAVPHSKVVVLLTGTPSPNGLMDLWSQTCLVDNGKTLGRGITEYRKRFFTPDYWGYSWDPKPGSHEKIKSLLRPMVLSMRGEDYIELPDRIEIIEKVILPEKILRQYKDFEKKLFMEHDGEEIEALSAAVLANKLLQFANGAIYTDDVGTWKGLHNAKMDVLAELIEENAGENIMVAYQYRHDLARLCNRFPEAVVMDKVGKTVEEWCAGKIKMLLVHPQSAGHGLNLQAGGSMLIWYGLTWSLEGYQQLVARLWRQGQERPVRVVHLVAEGTIDNRVLGVLRNKDAVQADLLRALRG